MTEFDKILLACNAAETMMRRALAEHGLTRAGMTTYEEQVLWLSLPKLKAMNEDLRTQSLASKRQ